ncbi:MAG: phage integrase N-terminal SAM-like domain-containing protein [Chloroflexota bacterium]
MVYHQRHLQERVKPEVEALLTDLAFNQPVVVSTQNQDLSMLLFLYTEVLQQLRTGSLDPVRSWLVVSFL